MERGQAVLITRPPPDALDTAARLTAMGMVPIITPLFQVRTFTLMPPPVEAVLVSSGHALPTLPSTLHGVPLLAVGDRTAARARAAGFHTVLSADGDAEALLALTRRHCAGGAALLLATGRDQGVALAGLLRNAGFRVHRRAVYAVIPARRFPAAARMALVERQLRAILFLSADTSRIFRRLLPDALIPQLARVDAAVIAPSSAAVIADLPWRRLRVSGKPTIERVLALL